MSPAGEPGPGFNAGAFMAEAISEGLSARQAIVRFREAGMAMSNQAFRSMYAQVRDVIGRRDVLGALDYSAIPGPEVYGTVTLGQGDRYATYVTSYVRRLGERDLEPRWYTYVTDQPHTPGEAIQAARDWLTDQDLAQDSFSTGVYQGSVVTSMSKTIGR